MLETDFEAGRLDLEMIHRFLCNDAYWSQGIPRATVERSIANSLCVGLYDGARQVGFARVVTDRATFAYLCDVFVLPSHRGQGGARQMVSAIVAHADLQSVRRFMLATTDAHALYKPFGFQSPAHPERLLERVRADLYQESIKGVTTLP